MKEKDVENFFKVYLGAIEKRFGRVIVPNSKFVTLHVIGMPPLSKEERRKVEELYNLNYLKSIISLWFSHVYIPLKKDAVLLETSTRFQLPNIEWGQLESGLIVPQGVLDHMGEYSEPYLEKRLVYAGIFSEK